MRRLPVLQNAEEGPERPRWHYLLIGAGFTVTLWLPLAMLALWLGSALAARLLDVPAGQSLAEALMGAPEGTRRWVLAAQSLPLLISFFAAGFGAATLVGRFGDRAGRREAILGNLLGSAVIIALAALAGGVGSTVLLAAVGSLILCSLFSGWGGAALGIKLRAKKD